MGTIISWVRAASGWVRSPFGDLPMLRAHDASVHQTWLILAGGMALILSRASQAELEERFPATRQVYAIARARLQKKRLPKPELQLLHAALREIANLSDPMTNEAGRECLARCIERLALKAQAPASGSTVSSANSTQVQSTQTHSTQAVTAAAPLEEHQATQIDLDLLFERSNKLRGAVAFARSTTFGQE